MTAIDFRAALAGILALVPDSPENARARAAIEVLLMTLTPPVRGQSMSPEAVRKRLKRAGQDPGQRPDKRADNVRTGVRAANSAFLFPSPSVDLTGEDKPTSSKAENGSSAGESGCARDGAAAGQTTGQASGQRPADMSVLSSIAKLSERYDPAQIADLRAGVALARQRGKISDAAWLDVLRRLEAHPLPLVTRCAQVYLDRHADGSRDERYLLGIIRREAAGNGIGPRGPRSIPGNLEFDDDPIVGTEKARP